MNEILARLDVKKINNLNGWQRIFVVIALMWGLLCAIYGYLKFPTSESINARYWSELSKSQKETEGEIKQITVRCSHLGADLTDEGIIKHLTCLGSLRSEIAPVRQAQYSYEKSLIYAKEQSLAELHVQQTKTTLVLIVFWITTTCFAYFIPAWVISGFRK